MANKAALRLLTKLKQQLKALACRAKGAAKTTASLAIIVTSLGYTILKAPELYNLWLRSNVGSKVYMIRGKKDGGGGTGFAAKAHSGQSYIVTNSHVCEYASKESEQPGTVLVQSGNDFMRRRIIEDSERSDLCLIEGMPGVEGLSVSATEPGLGDRVTVVGHPRLRPLSTASGDIVGSMDVKILEFVYPTGDPFTDWMLDARDGKCDKAKNEIFSVPVPELPNGEIKACLTVTSGAYISTATIFPGNSGSPVVDFWGNVIGVAFASDGTNWAMIVSGSDLRNLLTRY